MENNGVVKITDRYLTDEDVLTTLRWYYAFYSKDRFQEIGKNKL